MKNNNIFLEKLILDIENSTFQIIEKRPENETFELYNDLILLSNLSGNIGAFFIRAILNRLQVSEHHIFKWRLENKYRQYQVLNYYFPNCMPETIGFSQVLNENNKIGKIKEICKNGFFVKATLGHRTGENKNFDQTEDLDKIISSYQENINNEEKWILQKKLNLNEEFRIHSFGDDLIYGLTFIMEGRDSLKSIRAEEFVKEILIKSPKTILQGTLIGWDIGVTDTNEYYVIEANFTGFHPEFHRGFQTSGYFGDTEYGSVSCAWINNYFRNKYHLSIGSIERDLLSSDKFYSEFIFYKSIFNDEYIEVFNNKLQGIETSAIIYLGDETNILTIRLIEFFWQEEFAREYYIIAGEKYFTTVCDLFLGNDLFKIISEGDLFSNEKHTRLQKLDYETRKKEYCDKVIRIGPRASYFIV